MECAASTRAARGCVMTIDDYIALQRLLWEGIPAMPEAEIKRLNEK